MATTKIQSGALPADVITTAAIDDASVTHAKLHATMDLTSKTVTLPTLSSLNVNGDVKLDGNYPVGISNVALGDTALDSVTSTGKWNVAIGDKALTNNTTGDGNVGIGREALTANTTASNNTMIGFQSGYSTTTGGNNTAVGSESFEQNSTGTFNTAIGRQALFNNTTAEDNTAVGYKAAYSNTTANSQAAFGAYALYSSTTGAQNTAIGRQALYLNTTASLNTALGYQAGYKATTGGVNTFVGALSAGNGVVTGTHNVGLGAETLYRLTSGASNVSIGYQALQFNTTGSSNVAIGREALENTTTANYSTAIGYQTGYSNTTGTANTFIGRAAGYSNTTGNYNVYIGDQTGWYTTGTQNTFIGDDSGYLVTTGNNNTILGRFEGNQHGLDIRTSSNNIVLSDGAGNPRIHINSSGNVGIGQINPSYKLDVAGHIQIRAGESLRLQNVAGNSAATISCDGAGTNTDLSFKTDNTKRMSIDTNGKVRVGTQIQGQSFSGSQYFASLPPINSSIPAMYLHRSGGDGSVADFACRGNIVGSVSVSGSSTSYNTSSDYRLKENVEYTWDATTRLKQLKPARFNFIADADTTVDGFLAHEAQAVVPEAVHGTHNEVEVWKEGDELPDGVSVGDNKLDDDGNTTPVMQGIDQAKLVPLLVKTIQELEARITALEGA